MLQVSAGKYIKFTSLMTLLIMTFSRYFTECNIFLAALLLSSSMVSCSPGFLFCNKNGLVNGVTDSSSWASAPTTDVETCSSFAFVQINMGKVISVSVLRFWYYYGDGRSYCNQNVFISSTCAFAGEERSVYSCSTNCPTSSSEGIEVSLGGMMAQCVRWQSSRNIINTGIHFIEMKIFQATGLKQPHS
jgi:hypothetical protein